MLVDLFTQFNYAQSMAEAGPSSEHTPPPTPPETAPAGSLDITDPLPDAATTPTPEQNTAPDDDAEKEATAEQLQKTRRLDSNKVASSILLGLKNEAGQDITKKKAAQSIDASDYYGNLQANYFTEDSPDLPDQPGTEHGEPIKVIVNGREAKVVEINGLKGEDAYACGIMYDDDTDTIVPHDLTRTEVQQANLLAEKASILAALDGDQKAVIEKYFDHIDPRITDEPILDDEYTKQLENAANERGMITSANIQKALENHFKDVDTLPDTATDFIKSLEGKTLIDKSDMKQALAVMGVSRFTGKKEAAQLAQRRKELEGRDDTTANNERAEIDQQLELLGNADTLWAEAEKNGETPYDAYFDKLVNGEVPPEQAKAMIEAFTNGNLDGFIDKLPDMSEEEQSKLKAILKKSGKGALWILLGAIVGAAGAAVYGGVVVAGSATAGLKSQG